MMMQQDRKIFLMKKLMEKPLPQNKENVLQQPLRISLYPSAEKRYKRNTVTPDMKEKLQNITSEIKKLKEKVIKKRSAVLNDGKIKNLVVNGNLHVKGTSNIDNLKVGRVNGEEINDLLKDSVR